MLPLLHCMSPFLALFVESLQCTISGAIGGAADMPRARRAHQSDVNDPQETWAAQNCCCAKSTIAGCPSSTSSRRPRDGSVVSSPPLHGHDPHGRVTWQSTLDGENSLSRLAAQPLLGRSRRARSRASACGGSAC